MRSVGRNVPSGAAESGARAHAGHRGAHRLLAALGTHDAGANLTRSGLEVLLRRRCRDHGRPRPRVNCAVEGKEVDFLFDQARLIVETDSWRYHKTTRRAFEDDRARDVRTHQSRLPHPPLHRPPAREHPRAVAAAIAATLRTTGPRTTA